MTVCKQIRAEMWRLTPTDGKEKLGMERRYSLSEIDEMRSLVTDRMRPTGSYRESEHLARIEDTLRTLMANGTPLDELREEKRTRDALIAEKTRRLLEDVGAAVSEIKCCPVCGALKAGDGWGIMWNGRGGYASIQFQCGGQGYIRNDDAEPRPLKLNDARCGKKKAMWRDL